MFLTVVALVSSAVLNAALRTYFDQNGVYKGGLYSKLSQDGADGGTGKKGDLKEIGADRIDDFVTVTTKTGKKIDALNLSLHVGADGEASNKIDLSIKSMSAQGIGVSDLKVNTADSATAAIETLKNAIQTVSTQRSVRWHILSQAFTDGSQCIFLFLLHNAKIR